MSISAENKKILEDRRQSEIMAAAKKLFFTSGFDGTSIEQIAQHKFDISKYESAELKAAFANLPQRVASVRMQNNSAEASASRFLKTTCQ